MDHALKRGAPPESLLTVKSELIIKPVAESIKQSGGKKDSDKYDSIIIKAVLIITEMCRSLNKYGRETWAEAWGEALEKLVKLAVERAGIMVINPVKEHRNDRGTR